jgi:hypothetical protein
VDSKCVLIADKVVDSAALDAGHKVLDRHEGLSDEHTLRLGTWQQRLEVRRERSWGELTHERLFAVTKETLNLASRLRVPSCDFAVNGETMRDGVCVST